MTEEQSSQPNSNSNLLSNSFKSPALITIQIFANKYIYACFSLFQAVLSVQRCAGSLISSFELLYIFIDTYILDCDI